MAKTLYVGNLPWTVSEADLTAAFEAHAPVISARIVTDRETGKAKGFGFVEVDDNNADAVITKMNGFQLGGRSLIVNEAKPRAPRAPR